MEKFYNFAHIEKETQAFWRENKIYRFDPDSKAPVYSIDTPPPTVSGSLHIGHLFSFTQAEIIARFHRMQGENVFYPFGFDDNGLEPAVPHGQPGGPEARTGEIPRARPHG